MCIGYEKIFVVDKGILGIVYEGIFGAGYGEYLWILGAVYVEHMVPSMKGILFLLWIEYDTYYQGNMVLMMKILFGTYLVHNISHIP